MKPLGGGQTYLLVMKSLGLTGAMLLLGYFAATSGDNIREYFVGRFGSLLYTIL